MSARGGFWIGFMAGWGCLVLLVTWLVAGRGGKFGRWFRNAAAAPESKEGP